ncbi:MAG: glycosyltransferase family 2 protein [Bacteroidota bacterium]
MISIVIPIYNEKATVPELHRRLTAAMQQAGDVYEVIFVNDGSADASLETLKHFAKIDPAIKVVDLARNFGHQVALSAGIDCASGNPVILMDGDLQDPPELLPTLIQRWKDGYEVVYTVKKSRQENPFKRLAFRSFYRVMQKLSSIPIPLEAGNFSLMDRKVVAVLQSMPERNRYIAGMRAWAGFRQTGVEFNREARFAGKPQMTFIGLVDFALDGIFSFSKAPLRFATFVGMATAFVAFLGILWVFYSKFFSGKELIGWASTNFSVLFIGGTILLTLGIIGEYVGRIYDEVKQRPLYVIRTRIGFDEQRSP